LGWQKYFCLYCYKPIKGIAFGDTLLLFG